MRKFVLTLAIALSASAFAIKADAAPLSGSGVGQAADGVSTVEKTQFIYLGREYCWYPDGWRGPGFYWCGYNYRRGFGWGGGRAGVARGWPAAAVAAAVVAAWMGGGGMAAAAGWVAAAARWASAGGGGGGFMGGGPMGFGGGGGMAWRWRRHGRRRGFGGMAYPTCAQSTAWCCSAGSTTGSASIASATMAARKPMSA